MVWYCLSTRFILFQVVDDLFDKKFGGSYALDYQTWPPSCVLYCIVLFNLTLVGLCLLMDVMMKMFPGAYTAAAEVRL